MEKAKKALARLKLKSFNNLDFKSFNKSWCVLHQLFFYLTVMYKTQITKEEINQLPMTQFKGELNVIDTKDSLLNCLNVLSNESVLGFDTETRPAFKKGVSHNISLLQLSTSKEAFIFKLKRIGLPSELRHLLENQSIIKAGIAIRDDLKGLRKLNDFQPNGFIELAALGKQLSIKQLGLRSLSAMLLNERVSKKHQMTNWELPNLTEDQLRYAATDAWIGYKLYLKMTELIQNQDKD